MRDDVLDCDNFTLGLDGLDVEVKETTLSVWSARQTCVPSVLVNGRLPLVASPPPPPPGNERFGQHVGVD